MRREILERAIAHTCGTRDVEYGPPRASFDRTAALWSAYLGVEVDGHDVSVLMVLLKISRMKGPEPGLDTYEDAAAYAALAGELR